MLYFGNDMHQIYLKKFIIELCVSTSSQSDSATVHVPKL